MANTEIIKVLQLVRDGKKAANEALFALPGNKKLEELAATLEEIEGTLIASALEEKVAQLRQYQQELQRVNVQILREVKGLQEVSQKVSRVATALGLLVDLLGNAATLGSL